MGFHSAARGIDEEQQEGGDEEARRARDVEELAPRHESPEDPGHDERGRAAEGNRRMEEGEGAAAHLPAEVVRDQGLPDDEASGLADADQDPAHVEKIPRSRIAGSQRREAPDQDAAEQDARAVIPVREVADRDRADHVPDGEEGPEESELAGVESERLLERGLQGADERAVQVAEEVGEKNDREGEQRGAARQRRHSAIRPYGAATRFSLRARAASSLLNSMPNVVAPFMWSRTMWPLSSMSSSGFCIGLSVSVNGSVGSEPRGVARSATRAPPMLMSRMVATPWS